MLAAGGCAVVLAGVGPWCGTAAAADPTPSPTPVASGAACPDQTPELDALSSRNAWQLVPAKGLGATVDVIGGDTAIAHAVCTLKALAPQVTVRTLPVPAQGTAAQVAQQVAAPDTKNPDVTVFADESVALDDPDLAVVLQNAEAGGMVVVAAAGDGNSRMSPRPADVINVSAADVATQQLHPGSDFGQRVTLAGYGTDTAYAAGYVAATAVLVRQRQHSWSGWSVPQVAAQLAGSINQPGGSQRVGDSIGWGVVEPTQALSSQQIDVAAVPGLSALFPPVHPASSDPSAGGQPTTVLAGDTGSQNPTAAGGTAHSKGSSGGLPLVPVVGGVLLVGGAFIYLQRRRWRAMPEPIKSEDEWEPPQGPRHSGYSSPPE
jgi:hypothetical protein